MILSRLSRAIRQQNWFAVALEFVLVITGVVIGFQVSAWNEARQDRAREGLILCRLASDFAQIGADVRQHLTDAQDSQRMAEAIVTAAQTGMTPEDLDTLDIGGAIALRVAPAGSPTYAQLVTSGDMALIRSEPVRRALIDFHEELARFQRSGDSMFSIVLSGGGIVFGVMGLSSDAIEVMPERLQTGLLTRLESTEFLLVTRSIYQANVTNVSWKTTLVDAAERVEAALAPETAQCQGRTN